MENNLLQESKSQSNFEPIELLEKVIRNWKWFAISVICTIGVASIYLRYATKYYESTAKILIKEDGKSSLLSVLSSSSSNESFGGFGKNNIENEIEIIKSYPVIEKVVKKLKLNVSLYYLGNVKESEIYKETPIEVAFFVKEEFANDRFFSSYVFKPLDTNSFSFLKEGERGVHSLLDNTKKAYKYGEKIKTDNGFVVITKKLNAFDGKLLPIIVRINSTKNAVESLKSQLQIYGSGAKSSIILLKLVNEIPLKSENILDTLATTYNETAIEAKNQVFRKISKFITDRLDIITEDLGLIENDGLNFKLKNNLTDLDSEAKGFIQNSNDYNKRNLDIDIQINVTQSLKDYLKTASKDDLLPPNIVSGGEISGMIGSYNRLIIERNKILKTATTTNPVVIKINQEINATKASLLEGLVRQNQSLLLQKNKIDSKEGFYNKKIAQVPGQTKQFRSIERQQKLKEELYLFLLKKREEIQISLTSTESNARVIEKALTPALQITPDVKFIYLVSFLLGMLIPLILIYIKNALNTKIKSRQDIEKEIEVPFLGDIPKSLSASEIMVSESRSATAESLRIVRTNLEFMLTSVAEGKAKTIFVTSTYPKEGKTFVASNLAATFALSDKKVLLVGLDIRNPKLSNFFTLPDRGVTSYLTSKDYEIDDLIVKQDGYKNMYILPAGVIPPNPAELLMGERTEILFNKLKERFDYIIVDTAPVGLVADTLLVAKFADCFMYITRANVTDKRILEFAKTLCKEKKLPNMCMVLNDSGSKSSGYGYGYGYGYGVEEEKMTWYKKILKKLKR